MPAKQVVGTVVSNKMQKTVVVEVAKYKPHPLYGKRTRKTKKYYADTGGKQFSIGDVVVIQLCRPLSRLKRWRVVGLKGHLAGREEQPEEILPEVTENDTTAITTESGG
ncbi:MAG: 30S ribosomal protein S17 [bacterium JZ-2024 1]